MFVLPTRIGIHMRQGSLTRRASTTCMRLRLGSRKWPRLRMGLRRPRPVVRRRIIDQLSTAVFASAFALAFPFSVRIPVLLAFPWPIAITVSLALGLSGREILICHTMSVGSASSRGRPGWVSGTICARSSRWSCARCSSAASAFVSGPMSLYRRRRR